MFFKEQSLYEAKKATLLTGVLLINQRAKAINTVLTLMKDELNGVDAELNSIKNNQDKKVCSEKIHSLITRKVQLESKVRFVSSFDIVFLEKARRGVLSDNNSSYRVHILDPFDKSALLNASTRTILDYPYFSSSEFLLISENALKAAQAHEDKMVKFRCTVTAAQVVLTVTSAYFAGMAVGIALSILVNPVLGLSIMFLASVAYIRHSSVQLDTDVKTATDRCTQIKGKIDVGASDPNLFHELDELIKLHKPQPKENLGLRNQSSCSPA